MSNRRCERDSVKEDWRQQVCASNSSPSPRTPGLAQMMSTDRSVGMWKFYGLFLAAAHKLGGPESCEGQALRAAAGDHPEAPGLR